MHTASSIGKRNAGATDSVSGDLESITEWALADLILTDEEAEEEEVSTSCRKIFKGTEFRKNRESLGTNKWLIWPDGVGDGGSQGVTGNALENKLAMTDWPPHLKLKRLKSLRRRNGRKIHWFICCVPGMSTTLYVFNMGLQRRQTKSWFARYDSYVTLHPLTQQVSVSRQQVKDNAYHMELLYTN